MPDGKVVGDAINVEFTEVVFIISLSLKFFETCRKSGFSIRMGIKSFFYLVWFGLVLFDAFRFV